MKAFFHEPSESWAGSLIHDADGDADQKWRGCHFYIDDLYIAACKAAGVPDEDLFRLFSDRGERAVDDDKWMVEWTTVGPTGGVSVCYAVIAPNVARFERFLMTIIPSHDGVFPPVKRIVLPQVAVLPGDYSDPEDPTGTDIAKNGQGRFKYIAGEIVEPDDPRWVDLQIKWPHMGSRAAQ